MENIDLIFRKSLEDALLNASKPMRYEGEDDKHFKKRYIEFMQKTGQIPKSE